MEIPKEKFADCNNCQFVATTNSPLAGTKCCAYYPVIPNYMIGGILNSTNPLLEEGRKRIKNIITNKLGVTPYGIIPPVKHRKLYLSDIFKRIKPISNSVAQQLKCPLYNEGACSIWTHRTELCSTFFCISAGGEYGKQFWNLFNTYFQAIEHKLSLYAMVHQGYPISIIRIQPLDPITLKLDSENGALNEELYNNLWQSWLGNEEEFYINSYKTISQLEASDIDTMLSYEEKILEKKIKKKVELFNKAVIPDYLSFISNVGLIETLQSGAYQIKVKEKKIRFSEIQYHFMKSFNGTTSSYDILRKASTLHLEIDHLIPPFIENGLLKRV